MGGRLLARPAGVHFSRQLWFVSMGPREQRTKHGARRGTATNRPVDAWWPVVQIDRSDQTRQARHHEPAPQREHCVCLAPVRSKRPGWRLFQQGPRASAPPAPLWLPVESIYASSTVDALQSMSALCVADTQGLPLPGWVRVLGHSPLPRAPGAVWRLSPPLAAPNSQSLNSTAIHVWYIQTAPPHPGRPGPYSSPSSSSFQSLLCADTPAGRVALDCQLLRRKTTAPVSGRRIRYTIATLRASIATWHFLGPTLNLGQQRQAQTPPTARRFPYSRTKLSRRPVIFFFVPVLPTNQYYLLLRFFVVAHPYINRVARRSD